MEYYLEKSGANRKILLFVGATGRLGGFFVKKYSHKYTIVGIARRKPDYPTGHFDFLQADICTDADKVVRYVLDKYQRIDALVNGAVLYNHAKLEDKDPQTFREELEVNLIAPLFVANRVLKDFWIREGYEKNQLESRSIINISTTTSLKVCGGQKYGTYAAAKAGLNMLTKYMAEEYAVYGIRVNAVAPTSFPGIVGFEQVGSAIARLIAGQQNGEINILDKGRVYIL